MEEETLVSLSEFGLNEYEGRAYLAILESGVLVARDISDKSGIPYAKVYQVLDSLITKKIVIGDEGRPKKFFAVAPKEALQNRLNAIENEFKEQQIIRQKIFKRIVPILESNYNKSDVEVELDTTVFSITGLSNIVARITRFLPQLKNTIYISSTNKNLLMRLLKLFDSLNVEIYIRTNIEDEINAENIHVYKVDTCVAITQVIFDDRAMFNIIETNCGKFTSGEFFAILNQIPKIVQNEVFNFNLLIGDLKNE